MSLIQDALRRKREEEALQPPQDTVQPSSAASEETVAPVQKNKPSLNRILLSIVLVIVLVLMSLGAIRLLRSAPRSALQKPAMAVDTTPEPATPKPEVMIHPPVLSEPADPKKSIPKETWPTLKLSGFAAGGGQKMAVINGRMLSRGDRVQGATVIRIGSREVQVEYNNEQRTIYLDDE